MMHHKIQNVLDFFRYDITAGVKNLIRWFPVIWKDRNWDYNFIYMILKYKLHLMEKNIRNYGHHVRAEQDADKIKICVNLLDRLIKDEYHDNAFKSHYKKWGDAKMSFHDLKDEPGLCQLKIDYPNVKTEEDKKEQSKGFRICSVLEQNLKEQDLDLLFKLMRKHIQGWWD